MLNFYFFLNVCYFVSSFLSSDLIFFPQIYMTMAILQCTVRIMAAQKSLKTKTTEICLLVLNYQPAVNYMSHSAAGGSLLPLALATRRLQMLEPLQSGGPVGIRPSVTHTDTCHKLIVLPSIWGPNHLHSRWRPSRKTRGSALSRCPTQRAPGRRTWGHNYRGALNPGLNPPWVHLWMESYCCPWLIRLMWREQADLQLPWKTI